MAATQDVSAKSATPGYHMTSDDAMSRYRSALPSPPGCTTMPPTVCATRSVSASNDSHIAFTAPPSPSYMLA